MSLKVTIVFENFPMDTLKVVDIAKQLPDLLFWETLLLQEPMVVLRNNKVVLKLILLDQFI